MCQEGKDPKNGVRVLDEEGRKPKSDIGEGHQKCEFHGRDCGDDRLRGVETKRHTELEKGEANRGVCANGS